MRLAGNLLASALLGLFPPAAAADGKPARCFTSDEGHYPCTFAATDRAGSFVISADGRATYILDVAEPGIAWGFVELDGRNIALPGPFRRATDDPACWDNPDTQARICAW